MKKLITLIKKECIENRGSVLWIPLAISTLLIVAVIGSVAWHGDVSINLNGEGMNAIAQMDLETRQQIAAALLAALSIPFFLTLSVVVIFFLAHALFDERKDRSILFWKSLPISDRLTIGSKLVMALVVMPVAYWLLVLITQLIVLSTVSFYGLTEGINLWSSLWQPGLVIGHAMTSLTALLIHGFWMLPIYAWLLFCSSWAPRSPLMIAIAIVAIAGLGLSAWRVANTGEWRGFEPMLWLGQRISDSPLPLNFQLNLDPSLTVGNNAKPLVELMAYFSSAGLWLGVLVSLPLLAGAVYMRQRATA